VRFRERERAGLPRQRRDRRKRAEPLKSMDLNMMRIERRESRDRGVTTRNPSAGSMPAEDDASCPTRPVTDPDPAESAKGSEVRMVRCVIHGIAYDTGRRAPNVRRGCPRPVPDLTNARLA
jgi:hypothetical protein